MDRRFPASFSSLSSQVTVLGAKSSEGAGHGLLAHLLDVAAVCEVILEFEPPASLRIAAHALGLEPAQAVRWIAALVGLHDFGKAIPGFQAKWEAGCRRDSEVGLTFSHQSLGCHQHSLATAALLRPFLQRLNGVERLWCLHVVQAVSAHHGYHFKPAEVPQGKPLHEGPEWHLAREQLIDAYWATLSPEGTPSATELELPIVNWLAGLTSVADWIASNPDWFPLGKVCINAKQTCLPGRRRIETI